MRTYCMKFGESCTPPSRNHCFRPFTFFRESWALPDVEYVAYCIPSWIKPNENCNVPTFIFNTQKLRTKDLSDNFKPLVLQRISRCFFIVNPYLSWGLSAVCLDLLWYFVWDEVCLKELNSCLLRDETCRSNVTKVDTYEKGSIIEESRLFVEGE